VLSSIDIAETKERAEKAPAKASLVSGIFYLLADQLLMFY